ncbi:MAG: FAD-dependent oxidoreductase [Thermomicrobiales bacterium]
MDVSGSNPPVPTPCATYRGRADGDWLPDDDYERLDESAERCLAATPEAGQRGEDRPCSEVANRAELGYDLFATWMFAGWGMAPEDIPTLDAATYRDTGEEWPVGDGYGALVAHYHRDLDVNLDTAVTRVDWCGTGIRVTTTRGTIVARAAIVTVSTELMAAGTIAFDPSPPDREMEAVTTVPLGRANEVAFAALAMPSGSPGRPRSPSRSRGGA